MRWDLSADQVARIEAGPVALVVDHPAYQQAVLLDGATVEELLTDLRG